LAALSSAHRRSGLRVFVAIALLSYLRDVSDYLDATLVLALMSFVGTLAASNH
jgi:multisubunit Na+/H+ antiporter MnhF subunit